MVEFKVADATEPKQAEPNAVDCLVCGILWKSPDVTALQGEDWDICPVDDTHTATPTHTTREPLGVGNDEDFLIVRSGDYVYPLEQV